MHRTLLFYSVKRHTTLLVMGRVLPLNGLPERPLVKYTVVLSGYITTLKKQAETRTSPFINNINFTKDYVDERSVAVQIQRSI